MFRVFVYDPFECVKVNFFWYTGALVVSVTDSVKLSTSMTRLSGQRHPSLGKGRFIPLP